MNEVFREYAVKLLSKSTELDDLPVRLTEKRIERLSELMSRVWGGRKFWPDISIRVVSRSGGGKIKPFGLRKNRHAALIGRTSMKGGYEIWAVWSEIPLLDSSNLKRSIEFGLRGNG